LCNKILEDWDEKDKKDISVSLIVPIFSIIIWTLFYKPDYVYKEKR